MDMDAREAHGMGLCMNQNAVIYYKLQYSQLCNLGGCPRTQLCYFVFHQLLSVVYPLRVPTRRLREHAPTPLTRQITALP